MKPTEKEEILKDPARLLFERYYRAVLKFLIKQGFPLEDRKNGARDLAQEVYLHVYRKMGSNRGEGPWSFLKTTARNTACNEWRRRDAKIRSAPEVPLDAEPSMADFLASDFPNPEEELIAREEHRREQEERQRRSGWLKEAIEELPPKPRACLLLWLGGLSHREIQDVLGISLDAVKTRLNTARNFLRARLNEEPEGLDWPAATPEVDRDRESRLGSRL